MKNESGNIGGDGRKAEDFNLSALAAYIGNNKSMSWKQWHAVRPVVMVMFVTCYGVV